MLDIRARDVVTMGRAARSARAFPCIHGGDEHDCGGYLHTYPSETSLGLCMSARKRPCGLSIKTASRARLCSSPIGSRPRGAGCRLITQLPEINASPYVPGHRLTDER
jgi:hypothetical protein